MTDPVEVIARGLYEGAGGLLAGRRWSDAGEHDRELYRSRARAALAALEAAGMMVVPANGDGIVTIRLDRPGFYQFSYLGGGNETASGDGQRGI